MIYPLSWEFSWPYILSAFVGAYLIGSVPFGLLLTRLSGLGDIRAIGSGNIGATNVLRTGRKALAAATLSLDVAKGAAAVLIANRYGPDMAIVAAAGVMIGHVFPVWLKFNGGKGVSTAIGVVLVLSWPVGLITAGLWLATLLITRYASLAALISGAAAPVLMYFLADPQKTEFTIALTVLIWLRHAANIRRLVRGEETKVGRTN
jgi:glycerol-3-phosphate acyltransferase PlsY